MSEYGLKIKPLTEDANNMFRVVADQLGVSWEKMREEVVNYLVLNKERYAPLFKEGDDIFAHLVKMKKNDTPTTTAELQALCEIYRVNFVMYQKQGKKEIIINPEFTDFIHIGNDPSFGDFPSDLFSLRKWDDFYAHS